MFISLSSTVLELTIVELASLAVALCSLNCSNLRGYQTASYNYLSLSRSLRSTHPHILV